MSGQVVTLRPSAARSRALEVPAVIAPEVNLLRFSEALARAGIVGRFNPARGILIIEPAGAPPARCPECSGSRCDEDAHCAACGGTGMEVQP